MQSSSDCEFQVQSTKLYQLILDDIDIVLSKRNHPTNSHNVKIKTLLISKLLFHISYGFSFKLLELQINLILHTHDVI